MRTDGPAPHLGQLPLVDRAGQAGRNAFGPALRRAAGDALRLRRGAGGQESEQVLPPPVPGGCGTGAAGPRLEAARPSAAVLSPMPAGEASATPSAQAARAVAAVTLHRVGGAPSLEVATGDGVRYELTAGPGGVEILAHATPSLERVVRADLHAVAETLRRRGTPLSRVAVGPDTSRRPPAGTGGRAIPGRGWPR